MHNNMHMFWEKTDNGSKQGATDELTLRSLICSEAILLQPNSFMRRNFFFFSAPFTDLHVEIRAVEVV